MRSRRALPASPTRRGWCPGLARPMPTGDGLLARIHPPLGMLTHRQARAVAEGARRFGNGHIDLTARANLQVRGVSEATRLPLARLLEAAGLGDVRHDGGPQRLTLTSPLAGRDPAEVIDVPRLARAIESAGRSVLGLPAKTLVAIEGCPGIEGPDADFYVRAVAPREVMVAVASEDAPADLFACHERAAPAAVAALLHAFARSGRRRARDLTDGDRAALSDAVPALDVECEPLRDHLARPDEVPALEMPSTILAVTCPGPHPEVRSRAGVPSVVAIDAAGTMRARSGIASAGLTRLGRDLTILAVDAPFGRCTADVLDRLTDAAEALGAEAIRLSASRGFVLVVRDGGRATGTLAGLARDFIVAPDDPRQNVAACTGAPACASGSTPTLADAARIAEILRPLPARDIAVHVSGCAKGCARPAPADLTLVAREGCYGAVIAGGPGDPPTLRLPIEGALERLGRAVTVGLAAAFAPDRAETDRGRDRTPA